MTKTITPAELADLWHIASASDPEHPCAALLDAKKVNVLSRMIQEKPNAADWDAWMKAHKKAFPGSFKPGSRADVATPLTAQGRLAIANGEDPAHQPRRKGHPELPRPGNYKPGRKPPKSEEEGSE